MHNNKQPTNTFFFINKTISITHFYLSTKVGNLSQMKEPISINQSKLLYFGAVSEMSVPILAYKGGPSYLCNRTNIINE